MRIPATVAVVEGVTVAHATRNEPAKCRVTIFDSNAHLGTTSVLGRSVVHVVFTFTLVDVV